MIQTCKSRRSTFLVLYGAKHLVEYPRDLRLARTSSEAEKEARWRYYVVWGKINQGGVAFESALHEALDTGLDERHCLLQARKRFLPLLHVYSTKKPCSSREPAVQVVTLA